MMDYLKLVKEFDEVSCQSCNNERTIKRNEIIHSMYKIINNDIYDIYDLVKKENNGFIAFCLVLIKTKMDNYKKAYMGPVVSDALFKFLINNTNNESGYIQELSRYLLTTLIDAKLLTKDHIIFIREYVETYDTINCKEPIKRLDWIHSVLLNTYIGTTKEDLMGCMIGKMVGDSLGFQVEGHGPSTCKKYVDEYICTIKTPVITRVPGMSFGQYTDDSQLTRELLVTIIETNGVVDGSVYAKRMSQLFQPGNYRIVGYGKTCAIALEAVWNGAKHTKTGCTVGHGNGSAMRSAPIGLLYGSCSVKDIVHVAKLLSSITHSRESCMSGAAAIALASKYSAACKKINFDVSRFSKFVANTGHIQLDAAINMLPTFMKWSSNDVATYIIKLGLSDGESQWDGISAGVIQTVLWSLYSFCKHPSSYINCIAEAIAVGGDVDTTAAIAGALCGIRVGINAIPDIWKFKIHDLTEWDYNDICHLVEETTKIIQDRPHPEFRF